jgi:hypothetical protein
MILSHGINISFCNRTDRCMISRERKSQAAALANGWEELVS